MRRIAVLSLVVAVLLLGLSGSAPRSSKPKGPTPTRTRTATEVPSATLTQTPVPATATATVQPTETGTPLATATPTLAPSPTPTSAGNVPPFLGAPACAGHSNEVWHSIWNSSAGCHYDHEHGDDAFTGAVADAFPGFDLRQLLGGVEIGHTNPSSPMENTMKHGGFKWDVVLDIPCEVFESAQNCVVAAVVQYHNFGRYSLELETRIHTTAALVKACGAAGCGYLYTPQFQEYGQRVSPYQGTRLVYPDDFQPPYPAGFGPYNTADCVYAGLPGCRTDLQFIRSRNANTNSIWTSKPTGSGPRPTTSSLFRLLFRVRDTYQVLDSRDLVHPFTWLFVCSNDGGATFAPAGCRYNNSTSRVHEIAGVIPDAWDGASFDLDGAVNGRVTADGFTTRFGTWNTACVSPGPDCHPIKLVNFPVGSYGGALPGQKISNPSPVSNSERDIYFCGSVVCAETSPGAVPSGWLGSEN